MAARTWFTVRDPARRFVTAPVAARGARRAGPAGGELGRARWWSRPGLEQRGGGEDPGVLERRPDELHREGSPPEKPIGSATAGSPARLPAAPSGSAKANSASNAPRPAAA